MAKIIKYRVTFPGNKVFFREYEFSDEMTLFALNKFLVNDLDFAPDQMIAFKGFDEKGKMKGMYGLFDLGSGTIDGVTLSKTLSKGETTIQYVFDLSKNKFLTLTYEGEVEQIPHIHYPRLTAEKGRAPGQFSSKLDNLDTLTDFEDLGTETEEDPEDNDTDF